MITAALPAETRVVILSGEEFQRTERLEELLAEVTNPATRDFNCDVFHPDDLRRTADTGRFSDILMMFPMMADRRVIVVRNADDIPAEVRKKLAASIAKTPDTSLVIVEGEKVSLSPKPPARHLREETFRRIYERDLPSWIRGRFAKRGKKAADGAAAILVNNIGDSLRELDGEIEKITIAIGDAPLVTERDAERIVGEFRRHTVYTLTKAVGTGDFAEAARILRSLLESERGKETYYVASLAAHLMKIAEYRALVRTGMSRGEAIKEMKENDFLWKLNRMDEQVKAFDDDRIRRGLAVLAETDSALKRSGPDNELIVGIMLPRLMAKK